MVADFNKFTELISKSLIEEVENSLKREATKTKPKKTSVYVDESTSKFGYKRITKKGILP